MLLNYNKVLFFQQTIEKWRNVFLLSAIINILGNTVFVFFGQASVQSWNTYWETEEEGANLSVKEEEKEEINGVEKEEEESRMKC